MSANQDSITAAEARRLTDFLIRDDMPESRWILEGAFRWDDSLCDLHRQLERMGAPRGITQFAGAPPCLWSLDWHQPRAPYSLGRADALIRQYASLRRGLTLIFDRPRLSEADLEDPYGMRLVELLLQADPQRNAVCVAHDELARRLRSRFPNLHLICHVNRLVAETGKRGPELYERLGQLYHRTMLHPDDALRPALVQNLSRRQRLDVVVNDPCLRHCSVRRDHMNLLAARRARPCDMLLAEQVKRLCDRAGCLASSAGAPLPVGECRFNFLTREDSRRLYDAGIRCFHVQAQPYRNELTLLWDFLHCLFDERPEYSHYRAAITTSVLSAIHRHRATLPSGLGHFSSSLSE